MSPQMVAVHDGDLAVAVVDCGLLMYGGPRTAYGYHRTRGATPLAIHRGRARVGVGAKCVSNRRNSKQRWRQRPLGRHPLCAPL